MTPVLTEQQWQDQIDAEQVAHARRKPWPDPAKVRRVRIDDHTLPQHMAHAANRDREREGDTENV